MDVKFINEGKFLEISDVKTSEDTRILNSVSTAIPFYWHNRRQVEGTPVTYLKVQFPNYYMPAGLWLRLYNEMKAGANIRFLNTMYQDEEVTKESINDYISGQGLKYTLVEHQLNAVYTALRFRKTSVSVGTSGGKTFIAFCMAHYILKKTNYSPEHKYLVIVPSQLLCIQGLGDFEDYQSTQDEADRKLKTHVIYSGAKNKYSFKEANVVFSTYQSLTNFIEIEDWFEPFDTGVFVDEGHEAVKAVKNILRHTQKATYTNAFSGSFPAGHTVEMLNIETFIGAHLYQYKTAKLRDAGFTSDFAIIPAKITHSADDTRPYFEMLKHEYNIRKVYESLTNVVNEIGKKRILIVEHGTRVLDLKEMLHEFGKGNLKYIHQQTFDLLKAKMRELMDAGAHKDFNRRLAEEEFLFNSKNRHKQIALLVSKLDKNTLILSRRRNDVKGLYEAGVEYATNKICHLIMGGVSNKEKQRAIDDVKQDDDYSRHAVYGNVDMIGTGTSINQLFYAVFAGIGKSTSNAIQTVGRLIRKFHAKKKSFIFDTYDHFECDVKGIPSHWKKTYSEAHFKERQEIFKDEDYEILLEKSIELFTDKK